MFNLNDDELTERYKKIIELFFYIRTFSFGSIIKEIKLKVILLQKKKSASNEEAYFNNMILSQKRIFLSWTKPLTPY